MERTFIIGFNHTSGGDSLLPREDRGFFDGFSVEVTESEARPFVFQCDGETFEETLEMAACLAGEKKLTAWVEANRPNWIRASWEDLSGEVAEIAQ